MFCSINALFLNSLRLGRMIFYCVFSASCLEVEETDVPSSTILVKITEDGQAIIMREDGTDPTADIPVREQVSEIVQTSNTDDVSTAVKSILQDSGEYFV